MNSLQYYFEATIILHSAIQVLLLQSVTGSKALHQSITLIEYSAELLTFMVPHGSICKY